MFEVARKRSCERVVRLCNAVDTPFLLSREFQRSASRSFSSSSSRYSSIGRKPIAIPEGVALRIVEPAIRGKNARIPRGGLLSTAEIEGPLGALSMQIPTFLKVALDPATNVAKITALDEKDRKQKALWGTTRSYLQSHILGVSEGHAAILRLVGVGYRATLESSAVTVSPEYPGQQFVSLKLGYTHPIELGVPKNVKVSIPQPTRILVEGIEKEVVNQFAAEIRAWRKPEPYKGKGIFVNGETIKLKTKKIK
ncbi:MAG: hypothetical protein M4579_006486 [Chaenotheca gracillima]|nr:MAG: hypothetical protein M4579_006486 [Chaenotheca gracillima]